MDITMIRENKKGELIEKHSNLIKKRIMFIGNMLVRLFNGILFYYIFFLVISEDIAESKNRLYSFALASVCILIYESFARLYMGFKSGTYAISEIVIAHLLSLFFSDCSVWIICSVYARALFVSKAYWVCMLGQVVFVCIWAVVMNKLYYRYNIPRKVLIVNNTGENNSFSEKIAVRKMKFQILQILDEHVEWEHFKKYADLSDGVMFCRVSEETRKKMIRYCLEMDIRIYLVPEIPDISVRSSRMIHLVDTPMFMYDGTIHLGNKLIIKRLFDIVFSITAVIVLFPVFIVVAAAIKLEDGGPVFFTQERCTENHRIFKILKFRSMKKNAEQMGVLPTIEGDPRITKVGRFIRAVRIDELPQLFNIIKGDMSIVGPRPERIEHVEQYIREIPEFKLRSKMKGGLTGYAQIYGKYNTSPYDKLCMDLMYIENWSLPLDIKLILLTIKVCLKKESTEGFTIQASERMNRIASPNHR